MARVIVGMLVLGTFVCGCGSGESPSDAAVASTVCEALRTFDDALVDAVNASVAGLSSLPPTARPGALEQGFVEVRAEVAAWREEAAHLELGDGAEAEMLGMQLTTGADEALAELDDQHVAFRTDEIADRDVQGAVGEWFNSIEKVMSVSEPEIHRFVRRDFKQSFLDEPACRHVIQPFRND